MLCYSTHGGSGFSFTYQDVMAMPLGEIFERTEWLAEQRRREAAALKRATKSKNGK